MISESKMLCEIISLFVRSKTLSKSDGQGGGIKQRYAKHIEWFGPNLGRVG